MRGNKSIEEILEFLENLFFDAHVRHEIVGILHLFHGLLFFLVQVFRNVDADIYQQVTGTIAVTIAVHARKTLATQTEYLAWLSARFNLHLHLAVDGRNFYRTTECSCRYAQ